MEIHVSIMLVFQVSSPRATSLDILVNRWFFSIFSFACSLAWESPQPITDCGTAIYIC